MPAYRLDVFKLRDAIVDEYHEYVESFVRVLDPGLDNFVRGKLAGGELWPDAVLQLNPAFFHLYGIAHDDVDYIMDTFPIVRRKDEHAHGEYRTKRVILDIYDAMARATRTGEPYQTRLEPPPAADEAEIVPPREGNRIAG